MQRTLKHREMTIGNLSNEAWEAEAREADLRRAQIRLNNIIQDELDEVAQMARYHAGQLMIGCELCPETRVGNRFSREHEVWGKLPSVSDMEARQAFSLPNL